ncbi:hypothetical protein CPB85DRAFT_1340158 [Mucidula mucida]|nr:hypothetical protein CPB85DRAFT_1340158 [Mucidula mucida]
MSEEEHLDHMTHTERNPNEHLHAPESVIPATCVQISSSTPKHYVNAKPLIAVLSAVRHTLRSINKTS